MYLAFIFDTETSGLVENRTIKVDWQPEIIEFYGCLVDLDEEDAPPVSEVNFLIKPSVPIKVRDKSGKIEKITGLRDEDLAYAPSFKEVAPWIKNAIEAAPMVVAHNASFDKEIVDIEMERAGFKVLWPPAVCTVEQSMHVRGHRLSLSALYEHLTGEKVKDAHRAKIDVQALVRVARVMRKEEML